MYRYAQTNIQLFNQLHNINQLENSPRYSDAEMKNILNAYELAMCLFAGRFRASGKTFIAHLIGTASILAPLNVPGSVIAAGLIHAVYAHGNFGDRKKGINEIKREIVRNIVGEEIEEYVARYTAFKWNQQSISNADPKCTKERYVLLIRLANELEEHLDFAIFYCSEKKRKQYLNRAEIYGDRIVEIAYKLGFPSLAAELAKAFQQINTAEIPERLCIQNNFFTISPNSSLEENRHATLQQLQTKISNYKSILETSVIGKQTL